MSAQAAFEPRLPSPDSTIGILLATVRLLGEADRQAVAHKSGLSDTTVNLLLPAAVDIGLLDREWRAGCYVYRVAK